MERDNEIKKIVIYGAGGLGREIYELIDEVNKYNILGFLDDGIINNKESVNIPILGGIEFLHNIEYPIGVVFAISDVYVKQNIYKKILQINKGHYFPIVIAKNSYVSKRAMLSEGTIVGRYCSVSTSVQLGKLVFLNTKCDIGHDSIIGDFCSLMPSVNVSGNVSVGQRTLIGVQSAILQGIKIGSDVTVGMGSKVMTDVPDNCTVMGYPAKIIARHEPKE